MASCACFPAVATKEIDGQHYIDGGYYDNLPINLAISMGADEVIAVDLKAIGLKEKKIEITETGIENRFYYFYKGKYGIVDTDNHFIIPCKYDKISCWTNNKYRVLEIDQWGVIDENRID